MFKAQKRCKDIVKIVHVRDAPKLTFLAETEQIETLGQRMKTQTRFYHIFSHIYFTSFFTIA